MKINQGEKQWVETYLKGNLEIEPEQSKNFYRFQGDYTYRETDQADGGTVVSTDRQSLDFTFRRDLVIVGLSRI